MNDQADSLRKAIDRHNRAQTISRNHPGLRGQPSARARVIGVASGLAGVGKTSAALNIALALNELKYKVAFIDTGRGQSRSEAETTRGAACGATGDNAGDAAGVIAGVVAGAGVGVDVGVSRIKIISSVLSDGVGAGAGAGKPDEMRFLSSEINWLAECHDDYDAIFADMPAGASEDVVKAVSGCDEAIVVTTAEQASITDTYAFLKTLAAYDSESAVRIIVNKAADAVEAEEAMSRLLRVSNKFLDLEIYKLGYIIDDPPAAQPDIFQKPYILSHPQSRASKCVREIALRLAEGMSIYN